MDTHKWYHIAVSSSSNVGTLYVNGSSVGTTFSTNGTNNTGNDLQIGRTTNIANHFPGYITDVRIVKGTAVYSGNFTPPTGRLTTTGGEYSSTTNTERLTAITNTKLLTCHLPYISDGSSSGHSITVNGDPETKPFGPYDYNEYSATDNGGSIEFDGSGDYVSPPGHADFAFSTNDFTIEFFVYIRTHKDYTELWDARTTSQGSTTASPIIYSDSNGDIHFFHSNSNRITGSFKKNQWTHVALCRASSQTKLFINGSQAGSTYSDTTDYVQPASNWSIGASLASNNYFLDGSMSEIRAVNGTAVYSGNFTPPTGPLTTTGGTYSDTTNVNTSITASHTKLLLKCTDAHVIDKSQVSNLKLVGNAAASTTQTKFSNTASVYFDGTGDYVEGPSVSDLNIGTGDFTVECWVYETTLNTDRGIWEARSTGNATDGMTFTRINTDAFRVWSGGALITTGSVTIQNTWVHCAVVRYNGTLTIYINGSSSGTPVSNSTNFSSSEPFVVGGGRHNTTATPTAFMTGYVQDLRVSNYARYTSNFTVPSLPLKG